MKNLTQLIKGILTPAIQEVAKDIYKLSTKVNEAILKNLAQIKSADHITLATNITLDPDVNQCQGFTYNFKRIHLFLHVLIQTIVNKLSMNYPQQTSLF